MTLDALLTFPQPQHLCQPSPPSPKYTATPHLSIHSSTTDAYGDKATAKLLGAALGGSEGDIELGSAKIGTGYAPRWVQMSEKIKLEMTVLKERITKLKE